MLSRTFKAIDTELVIFNSSEYKGDVETFQDSLNSWLKAQPNNAIIEDIIYQHSGLNSKGKDVFSVAIISSLTKGTKQNTP